MPTVILNWTADPLAFRFSVHESDVGDGYGDDRKPVLSLFVPIPHIKFMFKNSRFTVLDRGPGIAAVVAALTGAGYEIIHQGDIPAEIGDGGSRLN